MQNFHKEKRNNTTAVQKNTSGNSSVICWLTCLVPGFNLEHFIRGQVSFLIMKGGDDKMKNRCDFYSKLGYCNETLGTLELVSC